MSLIGKLIDAASENLKTLLVVGGLYVLAVETGYVGGYPAVPELPGWWDLLALVGGSVAVVGYIVGSKLAELLPDPPGHYLVAQEGHEEQGGEIWELNDEAWQELNVVEGELFSWDGVPWDVFEVRRYNQKTNTAVANWKGTQPASELSNKTDTDIVMQQIRELRNDHEQEARYGKWLRQSLPSLLRYLDKHRAKNLNATLDKTLSPTWNGDGQKSIDDLIEDRVPEEALPDYFQDRGGDDGRDDRADEGGEFAGFEILDNSEALDATADLDGVDDPLMMNDGGTQK